MNNICQYKISSTRQMITCKNLKSIENLKRAFKFVKQPAKNEYPTLSKKNALFN